MARRTAKMHSLMWTPLSIPESIRRMRVVGGGDRGQAAVAEFLRSGLEAPTGLIIEGEPGIGKTTLWLNAQQRAREMGFRVLSARASAAEAVLAYGSLADLLGDVDTGRWAELPEPQLRAVDQVLLRAGDHEHSAEHNALGAALLTIVEDLSEESPLLLAIDDLQWLDASSRNVVAFVARRLSGRVGILATLRHDPREGFDASWLHLPRPDSVRHVRVEPLTLGRLHEAIHNRLGRTFSRPAMVRIHTISAGNPFYALELARAIDDASTMDTQALPPTLAELVRTRIGRLGDDVQDVLLACACLASPTAGVVGAAVARQPEQVLEMLEEAMSKGIVEAMGSQLRFAHPLLAHGVYTEATPTRRRTMHRKLAELVAVPELRARHLALATTTADVTTLTALDAAAESAALRGAPAAAAELLDLAIALDGIDVERQIRSAAHHFKAGATECAKEMLGSAIAESGSGPTKAEALRLLAAIAIIDGSALESASLLTRALEEPDTQPMLRVQIRVALSFALLNIGDMDSAVEHIENAVADAETLGVPVLLSQALSLRLMLGFIRGEGIDNAGLHLALELEDGDADVALPFRATVVDALLKAWSGHLDEAHCAMQSIRALCVDRGQESELLFVSFNTLLIEIWRGKFADAVLVADDLIERGRHLSDELQLFGWQGRAVVAAFIGNVEEARRDAAKALAASQASGANLMAGWLITVAGFLELSLGNHQGTLDMLTPLLAGLNAAPQATEIFVAGFLPDAVEAMIALGRVDEAEPFIERLEENGARLDRPWMLATAARCRSLALAARGELKFALAAAERALVEHQRLPMPFEYARTQLILGQLQRRQRQQAAASVTLGEAAATFERLGASLWAERARAELVRVNFGPRGSADLTATERRVATLAATGMTNRDVAAELFISQKTVESNLSRIYRKLGVRSRIELAQHIVRSEE